MPEEKDRYGLNQQTRNFARDNHIELTAETIPHLIRMQALLTIAASDIAPALAGIAPDSIIATPFEQLSVKKAETRSAPIKNGFPFACVPATQIADADSPYPPGKTDIRHRQSPCITGGAADRVKIGKLQAEYDSLKVEMREVRTDWKVACVCTFLAGVLIGTGLTVLFL